MPGYPKDAPTLAKALTHSYMTENTVMGEVDIIAPDSITQIKKMPTTIHARSLDNCRCTCCMTKKSGRLMPLANPRVVVMMEDNVLDLFRPTKEGRSARSKSVKLGSSSSSEPYMPRDRSYSFTSVYYPGDFLSNQTQFFFSLTWYTLVLRMEMVTG